MGYVLVLFSIGVILVGIRLYLKSKVKGKEKIYDLIVIGSGVVGSTSAICAAKKGLSVLVIEKDRHPRHKLGESLVPSSTALLDLIAETFNIPEFRDLLRYPSLVKKGIPAWPKNHFWFGVHSEGEILLPSSEFLFQTMPPPIGPDVHILRSSFDMYLASLFPTYGVDYIDKSTVSQIERSGSIWNIGTRLGNKQGKFLVDASGNGLVGRRFGNWNEPRTMKTNTRNIFGLFQVKGSVDLEFLSPQESFLFKRCCGTMHHCFKGGWIWVIPFDNNQVSVGMTLNRDIFPEDSSKSPEEEFWTVIEKFPSIFEHFSRMKLNGKIFRQGQIQKSCTSIIGEGYILTPHAAGFVDPLYSTGIAQSFAFILRFIPAIVDENGKMFPNYEKLRQVDKNFQIELAHADTLVASSYLSWNDPRKYQYVFYLWVLASQAQFRRVSGHDPDLNRPFLFGAGEVSKTNVPFPSSLNKIYEALLNEKDVSYIKKEFEDLASSFSSWEHRIRTGVIIDEQGRVNAGATPYDFICGKNFWRMITSESIPEGLLKMKELVCPKYMDLITQRRRPEAEENAFKALRIAFKPGDLGLPEKNKK